MGFKNQSLDWDATARRATLLHKEDGQTYIESIQDCEPLIEYVKDKARMPQDKDFKYLGELPKAVVDQAINEGWIHDHKRIRKWFADNPKLTAKWHQ